jgi:hypothetical protein
MIQWLLDAHAVPDLDQVVADAQRLVPAALGELERTG